MKVRRTLAAVCALWVITACNDTAKAPRAPGTSTPGMSTGSTGSPAATQDGAVPGY
ncbi:MAG: hypothetical protein QOF57_369 [Frankiaceae bacterium]|nr:hypothetical protein [Frankiaceae bacterium]MDQ1727158.1 hypothetical protein [Frankiaceae bacterium]